MDTSSSPLDIVRNESLTSLVQAEVERMIMVGELGGGQRVNEVALANQLRVSRGPVREALRALTQSGLLRAVRNRGVFVREIDLPSALDLYDIRAALDLVVGETVAAQMTSADIEQLESFLRGMHTQARARDVSEYYLLNVAFHELILSRCGNARLVEMSRGLARELHLFRRRGLAPGENMQDSNAEHGRIFDALRRRDRVASGLAMREHVRAAKQRVIASARAAMPQT